MLSREALLDPANDEALPVRTLVRGRVPRLYQDQSLDVALRFLKDRPMLPVVDRGNMDRLMGVVSVEDILARLPQSGAGRTGNRGSFLAMRGEPQSGATASKESRVAESDPEEAPC